MEPTFSYIYSIPYVIFFIILFLLFLWENKAKREEKNVKVIHYACMLVFFIFFGFRGYIDTDFALYFSLYENAPTLSNARAVSDYFWKINEDYLLKIEPGFKVLLVLLKTIHSDYFFLQIISVLIDVIFLNYFFKKYSPQYVLGFIAFLIFSGLIIEVNLLRNSKAIYLFIYSLHFIKERNALKFYLCNGIGLLFHSSAIFYFPMYFFLHKKISPQFVWGVFILGNFLYLGQIKFIIPIVIELGKLLGGVYELMTKGYSESKMYSTGYGITLGYVEKVLTFILFYRFYDKIDAHLKDEATINMFFNLFFIFTISYLYLYEYSVLIDRMTTLFVMSYWILYPYIYTILDRVFKMFFTAILFVFGTYKMLQSNNFITRKYENILWDRPSSTRAYYILSKHLDKILNPSKKNK